MGFYGEHVFPRLLDIVMNTEETRRIRRDVCARLHGRVLEIGFGTGHNLPYLPDGVTGVVAIDPLRAGRKLAAGRIAAAGTEVEFLGLDAEQVPLDDGVADTALSTWTLCSIDDPVAAVREVRRLLRPGGTFHFAEHGLAPDERVQRWQHRLNGLERKIACGCNLDRDIPEIVREGGMVIQDLETFYAKGDPKPWGWTFQGRATPA